MASGGRVPLGGGGPPMHGNYSVDEILELEKQKMLIDNGYSPGDANDYVRWLLRKNKAIRISECRFLIRWTCRNVRRMNKLDNIVDYLKVFNNIETYKAPGQRNMAHGGRIIGKPGGLVEEGVEYYATKIYKVTTGSHKGDWALPEFTYDPETKKKSTKVKYFKSKTDLNNYLKEI